MILCPKCGTRTNVYDSRISFEGQTRRKRECPSCSFRFATIEVLDTDRALHTKPGKPPKPKKEKPARPIKNSAPKRSTAKDIKRPRPEEDSLEPTSWDEDFYDVARELGIEGLDKYD